MYQQVAPIEIYVKQQQQQQQQKIPYLQLTNNHPYICISIHAEN